MFRLHSTTTFSTPYTLPSVRIYWYLFLTMRCSSWQINCVSVPPHMRSTVYMQRLKPGAVCSLVVAQVLTEAFSRPQNTVARRYFFKVSRFVIQCPHPSLIDASFSSLTLLYNMYTFRARTRWLYWCGLRTPNKSLCGLLTTLQLLESRNGAPLHVCVGLDLIGGPMSLHTQSPLRCLQFLSLRIFPSSAFSLYLTYSFTINRDDLLRVSRTGHKGT